MPIHAEVANRSTTVDPAQLLEIVRRWCPGAPVEVSITLVKALIEAAASGSSGELRLSLLEEFVLGLAAQLCSNSVKIEKLKKRPPGWRATRCAGRTCGQVTPLSWPGRHWPPYNKLPTKSLASRRFTPFCGE